MPVALEWRAKATASGLAIAQSDMGWNYETGEGVAQTLAEAASFYRLAAKQSFAIAMRYLGVSLCEGKGCEAAPVQAVL